ncbi:chromate transporter [Acidisphaera sp. L21]|jgi:chromate transporter|uniref:chromate transporter n=1 Tax=Acidisphaera sp. L21 TaxID=1641851 RepID=UPI00131B6ADA|nr:chromate transporter [Acidisphaera sp. L21]
MAAAEQKPSIPTLMEFFVVVVRIGLTSFGGGLSGWLLREFVQRRHWLDEEEFLSGLSLAQAFPGVNVVNLSIWIGYRLLGTRGALAGACGIIVPPAILVVLIAALFAALTDYPLTHLVLDGVGAAAVGLSLQMGIIAARRVAMKGLEQIVIMAAAFVAVGLLHISLPLVVVVLGALSVSLAYWRLARA